MGSLCKGKEFAKLRASHVFLPYVHYAPRCFRALCAFALSCITFFTHAPYLRVLRALFVRVKIVLGWICSTAKTFYLP